MKEAPKLSPVKIAGNSVLIAGLLAGCEALPLNPTNEFTSPSKPGLTQTLETPPDFTTPPPTIEVIQNTPTPEFTPTPEIIEPSIPHGLRPENAATQTYENGIWVVKNADGQVTATWNELTNEWTYDTENIITKQIILGYDVDPAVIEPFLGPLPPDDPSTHFIDPDTGKRVGYGIGPETPVTIFGSSVGTFTTSETEVFARFRGVATVPNPPGWTKLNVAIIVDVPQTADISIIVVSLATGDQFVFSGVPKDSMYVDFMNIVNDDPWGGGSGISLANEHLIGKMVAVTILHDMAPIFRNTDKYEVYSKWDNIRGDILSYLAGKSTQIPSRVEPKNSQIFSSQILIPESQSPTE